MTILGFIRTITDHCVCFIKYLESSFSILLLYLDDMLIVGQYGNLINKLKEYLNKVFEMKDLGAANQILGMIIKCGRRNKKI